MNESDAYHAAQEKANNLNVTVFVVTHRSDKGHDYQPALASQLNGKTLVVGSKEPTR